MVYSAGGGGRLPAEFTELAYIESSGTQYINTGYTPTLNSKIRVKFAPVTKNSIGYFGARYDPYRFCCTTFSSGNQFAFAVTNNAWSSNRQTISLDTIYDCIVENGKQTINGTEYTESTVSNWGNVYNFKLAGVSAVGQVQSTSAKYYLCQIWENGVLAMDLVPAKRNADSVVGMYDLVSGSFLTDANGGSFGYGEL